MGEHVKWDEANLEEIEANKPARQKITEPKTPFHRMIDDDDGSSPSPWDSFEEAIGDAIQSEVICSASDDMASSGENKSQRSGWTSSDDEADITDQDDEVNSGSERRKSFREHRRAHYDEYRKIKELRRKGSSLEEASDDEIEDLEKSGSRCNTSSSLTSAVEGIDIAEGGSTDNSK